MDGASLLGHAYMSPVRIAISPAAIAAMSATLPVESVSFEAEANERGEIQIWIDAAVVDTLTDLRGPGESYSDVILRLVEAGQRRLTGLKNVGAPVRF